MMRINLIIVSTAVTSELYLLYIHRCVCRGSACIKNVFVFFLDFSNIYLKLVWLRVYIDMATKVFVLHHTNEHLL